MKKRLNSENYYNKYQYLIWIDKKGFIDLENFSLEELEIFVSSIKEEIANRDESSDTIEKVITNKS
tara:strand:+ start:1492 stop:1689 length:198 start_codon:yes stop_codon:yes gene_type:complete